MFLGIEIGGTKLQLGVGQGDGSALVELERRPIDAHAGAESILRDIERTARQLCKRHAIDTVGIGFGGPVHAEDGRVIKSHQVSGWEDFQLAPWCQKKLGLQAYVENDCDAASLAEARFGAGRGAKVVLYITVGSGIGGGLVVDGEIYRGSGRGAAEIGHLRPGLHADRDEDTVETLASGWGIMATTQARLSGLVAKPFVPLTNGLTTAQPNEMRERLIEAEEAEEVSAADLLERCDGRVEQLTTKMIAEAAAEGNPIAGEVIAHACQVLGWAVAQAITLFAPGVVVVGGGVSQADEGLFLNPLRREIDRYVFPAFTGTFQVLPAQLGETVVVQGALATAALRGSVEG